MESRSFVFRISPRRDSYLQHKLALEHLKDLVAEFIVLLEHGILKSFLGNISPGQINITVLNCLNVPSSNLNFISLRGQLFLTSSMNKSIFRCGRQETDNKGFVVFHK